MNVDRDQGKPRHDKRWRILLMISRTTGYERGVLSGIREFNSTRPDWEFISFRERQIDRDVLARHEPDGIIAHHEAANGFLQGAGLPCVVLTRTSRSMPLMCVTCDDVAIARMAADTLVSLGIQHFAYVGLHGSFRSSLRHEAFVQRLRQLSHSTPVRCYDQPSVAATHITEVEPLSDWLSCLPAPAGLFAFNDTVAERVFEGIHHARLRVPEDLTLIGADNDEFLCNFTSTPLTSIDPDAERIGFRSAQILEHILQGNPPRNRLHLVQPIGVIPRRSTDVSHHDDEVVAEAIRFIREYVYEGIDAKDVIESADVSRATLIRRFKKATGRSLREEIDRQRLAHVVEYLRHTELPLTHVAERCGFAYQSGLNAFVRRHLNRVPSDLRRPGPV